MTTDGTNETTLPYSSYPYFSPLGTYVALISGNTISIVRRSDNTQVYSFSPTTESITELDWGPAEDKLVYLLSSKDLYIINVNGDGNIKIASSIENIAWEFGNRIVSIGTVGSDWGGRIYNATNLEELFFNPNLKGGELSISKINTDEVVYRGDSINQINIASGGTSPVVLIDRNDLWNIHLSPDGQKIVASGNSITGEQIWLINIDGSSSIQLK
jgi:Tol biopolymer transport system component